MLNNMPEQKQIGTQAIFLLLVKITVKGDSFLHVGGTPSPLTEKKQPVFSVDGQPVIPASSFKGAFRYQVEQMLISKKDELAKDLGLTTKDKADLLKPSIPASSPSKAEQGLTTGEYRPNHSEIKIEGNNIKVSDNGLCPVSYFFGATGLEGYLRIPNFLPKAGEWRIDQTRIRIDRKTGTAASGAIVTGEQVKPGSIFSGELWIYAKRQNDTPFGQCRDIGGTKVDKWLEHWQKGDDTKRQLYLLNQILIPALNNIKFLGGQKSLGGGLVDVSIDNGQR